MSLNESKYAIFQCTNCKRWIYARSVQKTSKCGFCQKSNRIPENPHYSTDKPTTALLKIKELNANDHQITNNELHFESKGKYKPVKLERPQNAKINMHSYAQKKSPQSSAQPNLPVANSMKKKNLSQSSAQPNLPIANSMKKKDISQSSAQPNLPIANSMRKKALCIESSKAAIVLKNFQIDKRIDPLQGIPLTMIPLILKNAGIDPSSGQKIIEILHQQRIIEYKKNKTAVYVV